MKKVWLIIIAAILLYLPSLTVYFSGDDFFHLRISQINSLPQFLSFFSFFKTETSASFYRPLPTQVFFFLGQTFFGLKPFFYHLIPLLTFGALLFVVYKVLIQFTKDIKISLLALFFYAFSVSHFSQVYYLSALQELAMALFYFSALFFWLKFLDDTKKKNLIFVSLFFILSLLCKETAVTFPLIAGLIVLSLKKFNKLIYLLPVTCYLIVYLILRLMVFGGVVGESYGFEFSTKIFNTLFWYLIWSVGIPEMFLDYIGSGLTISSKLWLYYNQFTKVILSSFFLFIVITLFVFIRNYKNNLINFTFYFLLFTLTLSPVLLLPWHKFPLELSVPMFFVAIVLGTLFSPSSSLPNCPTAKLFCCPTVKLPNCQTVLLSCCLVVYLILNITSYILTYQTHWVIRRGEVSQKVINYFRGYYPKAPEKPIYFYNNSAFITDGWGASKHLWISLSGSDALQTYYRDKSIKVFYEDLDGFKNNEKDLIQLGSKEFLGY